MVNHLRRAVLAFSVVAVTAASAGAAFAAEGGGGAYTGSPYTSGVVIGGMLPSGSNSQGEPQSPNSLPPGFMDGTPAMQHHVAMERYWTGQG